MIILEAKLDPSMIVGMNRIIPPKLVISVFLLATTLLFTGCSDRAIDFVIVNRSDHAIEIKCKADNLPGNPIERIGQLATISDSKLRAGDREWRLLSDAEYQVDVENRVVIIHIMPGDALRVAHLDESVMKDGEPMAFSIEEIDITGAYGEINLEGKQVPGAFIQETDKLHTLTYK